MELSRVAPLTIALATGRDREAIYRARHQVYAAERGQHPVGGILGRVLGELDSPRVALKSLA